MFKKTDNLVRGGTPKYRIRYQKKFGLKKVSETFGIAKSIGFSIGNIWYGKKFRIWFRSDFWYRHTLADNQCNWCAAETQSQRSHQIR